MWIMAAHSVNRRVRSSGVFGSASRPAIAVGSWIFALPRKASEANYQSLAYSFLWRNKNLRYPRDKVCPDLDTHESLALKISLLLTSLHHTRVAPVKYKGYNNISYRDGFLGHRPVTVLLCWTSTFEPNFELRCAPR